MSFEQQLRPAFDTLTASLRSDMERHLDEALRVLSEQAQQTHASAQADRDAAVAAAARDAQAAAEIAAAQRLSALEAAADTRLQTALREAEHAAVQAAADLDALRVEHEALVDDLQAQHERTVRENGSRFEQVLAEAQARTISSLQAADLAAGTRLVEAFRAIDRAQTLTENLNILADAVAEEAARSAIFLAGTAQVKSWRTHGFEHLAAPIELPLDAAGLIADAMALHEAVSVGADGGEEAGVRAPAFAALPAERSAIAVPMLVSGEVVAVVYADQGAEGEVDRASWAAIVELLARHASRSLEAITAHRLATTLGAGAARPRAVAKPADVVVVPRPAAAPASSAATAVASVEAPPLAAAADPMADDPGIAAQRLAQTLITEIRIAHEADVAAGVRDGDLMSRLGGPISQAWAQYEANVPEAIRSATNYFHAEMVRTLAGGDASLLTPRP